MSKPINENLRSVSIEDETSAIISATGFMMVSGKTDAVKA